MLVPLQAQSTPTARPNSCTRRANVDGEGAGTLAPAQSRGPGASPLCLPTQTRLPGVGRELGDMRTPGWLWVLSPGESPSDPNLLGSLPREPDQGSSRPRVPPSLEAPSPQRECPAPRTAQGTERETKQRALTGLQGGQGL